VDIVYAANVATGSRTEGQALATQRNAPNAVLLYQENKEFPFPERAGMQQP